MNFRRFLALLLTACLATAMPISAKKIPLSPIDWRALGIGVLLETACNWVLDQIDAAGEQLPDPVELEELEKVLQVHLEALEKRQKTSQGEEKLEIKELIEAVRHAQGMAARVQNLENENLQKLRSEVEQQRQGLKRLEVHLDLLEAKIDGIDEKLNQIVDKLDQQNDLMTAECRDLHRASLVNGYRVQPGQEALRADHETLEEGRVGIQVYLDSCTRQLDRRGILVLVKFKSFAALGRGELWISIKDVANRGEILQQQRVRLDPEGRAEVFLPYFEMILPSPNIRFELASVLTANRQPIYSFVGQVVECQPGAIFRCFWFD